MCISNVVIINKVNKTGIPSETYPLWNPRIMLLLITYMAIDIISQYYI